MDIVEQHTVMDSDVSSISPIADGNFAFAFNDSNFSDRLLRIEITSGLDDIQSCPDGCSSIADWARHRKRRREDFNKESVVGDLACCSEEQILDCNQPDMDDEIGFAIHDEERVAMIEESPSGDEEDNNSVDSNWGMDCSTVMRVRTLHISSPILAAKSPFFYKLFSNGMRESEQRHVTIRISSSEESTFIALLNFMYSNHIPTSTPSELLDLLMAADKFEVASCMRYCSKLLRDLPMNPESALLFLDLPSGVLMAEAVQPLTDAAKQYLSVRYQDLSKSYEGVMTLPLAGIEAVLSSDNLIVGSEDVVYDFVLKWAKAHYPNPEERRDILGSRLSRFIRFPQMSPRKLKKVQSCPDFDPVLLSKLVMDALFFKTETLHRQQILASEESAVPNCRYMKRNYKYRPMRTVEIDHPRPQVLAFLNLKRAECKKLEETSGRVYSESFPLDGQGFFLSAHYNRDQAGTFPCFGLFLGMQQKGLDRCIVDYEFAAREKPSESFERKYKGSYTFSGGKAVGYRNLFGMPWDEFISEDSPCFINDTLFLRAELTVVTPLNRGGPRGS